MSTEVTHGSVTHIETKGPLGHQGSSGHVMLRHSSTLSGQFVPGGTLWLTASGALPFPGEGTKSREHRCPQVFPGTWLPPVSLRWELGKVGPAVCSSVACQPGFWELLLPLGLGTP